ncbi:MAG TPA: MFS transporter [Deltaproteobacteria bacterium]|nr:MFS transporter [Deltaproteobacteria bacterium]
MTSPSANRPENGSVSFRSYLFPILFITSLFYLNFIARIISAPLLPTIEADLAISHAQAGSLFLIISSGYFITLLGSGFISSRISHRKTIALSAVVLGLALIATSFSSSLWAVRAGLLLTGMASGFYLPSGLATLTSLVHPSAWGKAIAIHELAPNLSFITAPLIAEVLLLFLPWRGIFLLIGLFSLCAGCAFIRFGRGGNFQGQAPGFSSMIILLREPSFWIMLILFSLGIGVTLGIYTMLPLYLVTEHGIDRSLANTVVSLSRISCIVMAFAGGWASDRFGAKRSIGVILLLSGVMTVLLGNTTGSFIIAAVFLQPLIAACFFPPGIAALSSIGPPAVRNVTISLTIPFAFVIGSGVIPAGIGLVGDAGSFGLGITIVGILTIFGAILSHFLCLGDMRATDAVTDDPVCNPSSERLPEVTTTN